MTNPSPREVMFAAFDAWVRNSDGRHPADVLLEALRSRGYAVTPAQECLQPIGQNLDGLREFATRVRSEVMRLYPSSTPFIGQIPISTFAAAIHKATEGSAPKGLAP
jgi:hypothetical protein